MQPCSYKRCLFKEPEIQKEGKADSPNSTCNSARKEFGSFFRDPKPSLKILRRKNEDSVNQKDKTSMTSMQSKERQQLEKSELRNQLIRWFKEELSNRSPEELTKKRIEEEFPEKWEQILNAFSNYGIALRCFDVPEDKVQRILELSLKEIDPEVHLRRIHRRRKTFAYILSKLLDEDPEILEEVLDEFF